MIQVLTMNTTFKRRRRSERGYVLLILLLAVALLSILSLKVIQEFKYQYQRDREEELIHRGVQYSRAVRRYYKKFGRYPTRIEDLESTNHLRFLRKRYKDPMNRDPATGQEKDFKLLHLTDVQMAFNSGPANGLVPVPDMSAQQAGPQGMNGISTGAAGVTAEPNATPQNGQATGQGDTSQADQEAAGAPPPQPLSQQAGPTGAPQVFGGGAIVGVASLNKDKTIREFNKKDHYNQWQFIYDPTTDRGGLLMTPNQPPLQGATQNAQQNGQQQNGQQGLPGQQTGVGFSQGVNAQPQQPQQPNNSPDQQ
jgi:type II secretory pathway pseudopilin PulG